jgi:hypothetical protein
MARFKVFQICVLLTLFGFVLSSKLIYRKYEKKHPKRNYVQIVEVFETHQEPPGYSKSDRELNDFLARDTFSTDMNCTKKNETEIEERPTMSPTTLPTIPSTAFPRHTTPSPTRSTSRTPNLTNLFTIPTRPTKPTIRPNPRENKNPDYRNIDSPTVQVTKHLPNPNTPVIVITEADDQPKKNNPSKDFEKDLSRAVTKAPPKKEFDEDEEVIYPNSGEDYDLVDEDILIEPAEGDVEYSDENEDEDYDDLQKKRRKRQHRKTQKIENKHKNSTKV